MYSKDASQAIRSCYAQLRCWLMYDGVRIKGGSRYQICEELSRKYSSEMADQYRKVTRLAEKPHTAAMPWKKTGRRSPGISYEYPKTDIK